MTGDKLPRTVRPIQLEYLTVGYIVRWYSQDLYTLTEKQFVDECMMRSGGGMNPKRAVDIYNELMYEAGL
jgi:hypothetical protein